MAPSESYVQVAADGVGKKVRNLSVYARQSDGTVVLVQMQVVALVDEDGVPIDMNLADRLEELVRIGRQQRFLLRMLLGLTSDGGGTPLSDRDLGQAGEKIL